MYAIDFIYHLYAITAASLRLPKRMAWKQVIVAGLRSMNLDLLEYRDEVNREASYTGQTMSLERMLNIDYFQEDVWASPVDPTAGGHIWIEHLGNELPITYTWYDSENQEPVYTWYDSEVVPDLDGDGDPDQVYTYYEQEYQQQISFKVWVPASLSFNEAQMRARIDAKIPAGFNYEIVTY